jgi:hypothetical protein
MNPYISVFEIIEDNKVFLKERMIQLENEIVKLQETNAKQLKEIKILKESNSALKETIDARNEENAPEILDYFHSCSSIRRTAWAYGMEMAELYELIPQWEDCRDGLRSADDYKECRIEIIGRREYDEELEEDMTKEELAFRERPLDEEDIRHIISDYKDSSELTLYELADRYELKINYLFKLLKENKVLDKETEAKGYAGFYEEHMGSGCEWDGKSELGLIQ